MTNRLKTGIIGGGGSLAQTLIKAMLRQGVVREGEPGIS